MVQSVLRDVLKNTTKHISVEDIQKRVCEYYNIRLFDMISKNRTKDLARARQIAMFLSKDLTDRSFPDIGKRFGGRDHTTVLHACRNINQLIAKEEELRIDIDVLKKSLKG
jgi:chromosomal replication initiator protein